MRKLAILLCVILLLLSVGCGQSNDGGTDSPSSSYRTGGLQIHFLDVGQADSILIQTNEGDMLIDAGNNDDGDLVVKYLNQLGIKRLAVVMGTHPHEDHIGGLDTVINSFAIDKVYLPKVSHNTDTYRDVLEALKGKNLKATAASGGQSFSLGDTRVEILAPNSASYEELNNYSIVCKVTYGNTSFLLTGDAETISEEEMLKKGYNLKANVLKVGHHGSNSSTSEKFLRAVSPEMAVISVGQKNDYGHPHRETIQRLAAGKIKVYQTALQGTIIMSSDGKEIQVKTSKTSEAAEKAGSKEDQEYTDAEGKGLIKGNINKKGDKIYHLPGQANYERTQPEAWFKTEQEAQAAGFRRAVQ